MKNALTTITAILFFLGVQFQSSAASWVSDPRSEVMQLENQMEERITPIIRSFDPTAFVVIKIDPKKGSAKVLPGTAYVVQDMLVKSQDGAFEIEKAEITVFGKETKKLEAAIPMIKKFATRFGIQPLVNVTEYAAPEQSPADKKEPKPIEENDSTIKQFMDVASHGFSNMQYAIWAAIGAAIVLLFALILGISKTTSKLAKSLEQGLQGLGATIESSGGTDQRESLTSAAQAAAQSMGAESPQTTSITDFSGYNDETFFACLSDCYWGEFDSYASFLWKRMPVAQKSAVLKKAPDLAPHLIEYVVMIASFQERDLGAINDPSYLNPLPIYHINNTDLTALVRKTHSLAFSVSALRLKGLELTLGERVNLRNIQAEQFDPSAVNFSKIPGSTTRKIKRQMAIEISSVKEEQELLSLDDISNDLIGEVSSLVWAMKLPAGAMEEILKNFSAKDLAYAWIAPEEVLVHLTHCLPAKKLELLQSLQKKIAPSRASESFKALHSAIAEKMKGQPLSELNPESHQGESSYEAKKKAA